MKANPKKKKKSKGKISPPSVPSDPIGVAPKLVEIRT